METTVCQEAKEIKDHLEEINQSINTLVSSSAAKQSSRGEFLKTLLLCLVNQELPNCCHLYEGATMRLIHLLFGFVLRMKVDPR